jgi:glycosyltransferase involved in cell wall biosynthesis
MKNKLVFIQTRASRGGAQVALSRLMSAPAMRDTAPLVVLGSEGWLAENLRSQSIDVFVTDVPSARSLTGKLWSNRRFARRIAERVGAAPLAFIANNHQEAIHAVALAQLMNSRSAVILRDSYLTKSALEKYLRDKPDHILAVGTGLTSLAQTLNAGAPATLLYDSVEESDFAEPKPKPSQFPAAVLVIGSSGEQKGWRDWMRAVAIACARDPRLAEIRFDFTGSSPENTHVSAQFRFIGHDTSFKARVRAYDLAVNPSKLEAFGLAAAETLAAGVPLLSTSCGVIGSEIPLPVPMMMPKDAEGMADALLHLYSNWTNIDPRIEDSQHAIRSFTPAKSAAVILTCVERVGRSE